MGWMRKSAIVHETGAREASDVARKDRWRSKVDLMQGLRTAKSEVK